MFIGSLTPVAARVIREKFQSGSISSLNIPEQAAQFGFNRIILEPKKDGRTVDVFFTSEFFQEFFRPLEALYSSPKIKAQVNVEEDTLSLSKPKFTATCVPNKAELSTPSSNIIKAFGLLIKMLPIPSDKKAIRKDIFFRDPQEAFENFLNAALEAQEDNTPPS